MVAGHKIDAAALVDFASAANIIIAHNAGFDRKFAERSWDFFRHRHWAWPSTGIDWRRHGLAGAKLAYLLNECGFFHGAHRALDDCHATLEILARPLPGTNKTALAALLDQARAKSFRVRAEGAPFNLKELLRRCRYRWNDGSDGRPKSWHIDVEETALANELDFLRKETTGMTSTSCAPKSLASIGTPRACDVSVALSPLVEAFARTRSASSKAIACPAAAQRRARRPPRRQSSRNVSACGQSDAATAA